MSVAKAGLPSRLFGNAVKIVKDDKGAEGKKIPMQPLNSKEQQTRNNEAAIQAGERSALQKPMETKVSHKDLSALDMPLEAISQQKKRKGGKGGGGKGGGDIASDGYGPARRGRRQQRSSPYDDWDENGDWDPQPQWRNTFAPSEAGPWRHDMFTGPTPVGSQVFVRNLPKGCSVQQLRGFFGGAGIQVGAVQIDAGPLPTATVNFLRQDQAVDAANKLHGTYLQGHQLKVCVKQSQQVGNSGDDDFWRKELKNMPKIRPQDDVVMSDRFGPGERMGRNNGRGDRGFAAPEGGQGFLAHQGRKSIFDRMG